MSAVLGTGSRHQKSPSLRVDLHVGCKCCRLGTVVARIEPRFELWRVLLPLAAKNVAGIAWSGRLPICCSGSTSISTAYNNITNPAHLARVGSLPREATRRSLVDKRSGHRYSPISGSPSSVRYRLLILILCSPSHAAE